MRLESGKQYGFYEHIKWNKAGTLDSNPKVMCTAKSEDKLSTDCMRVRLIMLRVRV